MSNMKTIIVLVIGTLLGALSLSALQQTGVLGTDETQLEEKKPLYWVAPMDANYRRDQPGQSPMGMDLVPVYEEANASGEEGGGTITISPTVVNNLGVTTTPVELKVMPSEIITVGYVQFDEDKLVHIHPRVSGWIDKLSVKTAGNRVKKGQPLYSLYSPELVNAQEEFLIALKRGNRSLVNASKERLKSLQLSTEFIRELQSKQKVQQNITFFAPQSGVIHKLEIREGFYVKPGNTLMSIGQLDQVWVEAEVYERDIALIEAGLPVTMTLDALPGQQWTGVIDYVYPTLNPKTRTLRIRLKFENAQHHLNPNMFAQIAIQLSPKEKMISVPKEAVIRTGKQDRVVIALGEGQFKSIAVTLGHIGSQSIEILEGLNEGDQVVTSAHFLIDSESSKTSDFKRMTPKTMPDSVWTEGQVNSIMVDHGMINISHVPVPEWGWPEMTMDFTVADQVDLNALAKGQTIEFQIIQTEQGNYEISALHLLSEPSYPTATVEGVIEAINEQTRVLTIAREPIEKWNRAAATLDFMLDQAINLANLTVGDEIVFSFEVREDLVITDISPRPSMPQTADHSSHDMGGE